MEHRYREVLKQLDLAYPPHCLHEVGVDFDRGGDMLPLEEIDSEGRLFVTLRSLDWDTRERVLIGRPMSELERFAAPRRQAERGWSSGKAIADAMDEAVVRLREPPPFYVRD